jgi:hypothetical protein
MTWQHIYRRISKCHDGMLGRVGAVLTASRNAMCVRTVNIMRAIQTPG